MLRRQKGSQVYSEVVVNGRRIYDTGRASTRPDVQ